MPLTEKDTTAASAVIDGEEAVRMARQHGADGIVSRRRLSHFNGAGQIARQTQTARTRWLDPAWREELVQAILRARSRSS